MDGLGQPRPITPDHAHIGGCNDLGPAEDDDDALHRRASGIHQPDDAVDDAPDAGIFYPVLPQRFGPLLDYLQPDRGGNPVLADRVGTPVCEINSGPGDGTSTVALAGSKGE